MARYQTGELNQLITLKRFVRTSDGAGGISRNLQEITKAWAHVRPQSGREREQANRLQASSMYIFAIRRTEISEVDVIEWQGVTYNVRFVRDRGSQSLMLEFEAERGVAS